MKTWTLMLGCVAAVMLAAGLCAQEARPPHIAVRIPMAWGKVVSLDKEAKTLTIDGRVKREEESKNMVFSITDETKVLLAGDGHETKAGTLDDVKPDKRVSVVYKEAVGDAKPVALSIRIMADRPAGEAK